MACPLRRSWSGICARSMRRLMAPLPQCQPSGQRLRYLGPRPKHISTAESGIMTRERPAWTLRGILGEGAWIRAHWAHSTDRRHRQAVQFHDLQRGGGATCHRSSSQPGCCSLLSGIADDADKACSLWLIDGSPFSLSLEITLRLLTYGRPPPRRPGLRSASIAMVMAACRFSTPNVR